MAGSLGVDFSFARISAADLKGQGYTFVCRYLASSTGKRISVAEVTDFKSEDLGIVLVWEDNANQALNGHTQGVADAQEALNQAGGIGWPGNLPIYFAVDFDATEAQQAAIDDYLRGVASVIGLNRVGVYGGYYVVMRCLNNGTATFAWQTVAWSGGQIEARAHIYQNGQSAFGGNADIDQALQTNFGQWSQEDEVTKPTQQQVIDAFQKHLKHDPTQADIDYYVQNDVAFLYAALLDSQTSKVDELTTQVAQVTSIADARFSNEKEIADIVGVANPDDTASLVNAVNDLKAKAGGNSPVVPPNPPADPGQVMDVTPPAKPLPGLDPMPYKKAPVVPKKTLGDYLAEFWKAIFG